MNRRVKKFLRYLLKREWCVFEKLPKGIGVRTVEFCISRGFVKTKKVDRKRRGNLDSYRVALRITLLGKDTVLDDEERAWQRYRRNNERKKHEWYAELLERNKREGRVGTAACQAYA